MLSSIYIFIFRIQEFLMLIRHISGWIHGRFRTMKLKKWKKQRKFQKMMTKAGLKPQEAYRTWVKINK